MKATPSKDGLVRFTLTIRRRAGLAELADAVGWKATREADLYSVPADEALRPLASRKAILKAAVEAYGHDGDSVWTWTDNCPTPSALQERARELVLKKFPELRPSEKGCSEKT